MNLLEYGELYKIIEVGPAFDEKLARYYFKQLIECNLENYMIYLALEFLHCHGVAHLDIKPENLLIDKNFQLHIADFGFAQKTKDE